MAAKKANTTKNKRLTRSETNRVLGGVAVGLGDFFDVDPTIIRVIFVLLTVFGGSGILIYLLLWLIIPAENATHDITEESIKKSAYEMKQKAQKFAGDFRNQSRSDNSKYLLGVIVLTLGVFLLLGNFNFFRFFDIGKLWPFILILLGIAILSRKNE